MTADRSIDDTEIVDGTRVGSRRGTLASLVVTSFRGERVATIALGTICVIGETLCTVGNPDQPLGWFAWLARPSA